MSPGRKLDRFYQEGWLDFRENLHPNQFCILKFQENPSVSALAKYREHKLRSSFMKARRFTASRA